MTRQNSDFQGNPFLVFGKKSHLFILTSEMKSKDPEEHLTTHKLGCGELLVEKLCFVYKTRFCKDREFLSEGRCLGWIFRQ